MTYWKTLQRMFLRTVCACGHKRVFHTTNLWPRVETCQRCECRRFREQLELPFCNSGNVTSDVTVLR